MQAICIFPLTSNHLCTSHAWRWGETIIGCRTEVDNIFGHLYRFWCDGGGYKYSAGPDMLGASQAPVAPPASQGLSWWLCQSGKQWQAWTMLALMPQQCCQCLDFLSSDLAVNAKRNGPVCHQHACQGLPSSVVKEPTARPAHSSWAT